MYRSFAVDRFRGFRHFTIDSLGRVNLITGQNGVGKTALLEAIFLHLGPHNPDLPLRVQAMRGIERTRADAEELWGWLFYSKDVQKPIKLSGRDMSGKGWDLTLRLVAEGYKLTTNGASDSAARQAATAETVSGPRTIVLDYQDTSGVKGTAKATIGQDGIRVEGGELPPMPPGFFATATSRIGQQEIERLSQLEEQNRQDEVVESLRLIEPRLKRLSVLVSGGAPMIYGDIGLQRLVPMQLLGQGLGRLLTVLLAIATCPQGYVLIDEIENGVHYSAMRDVWRAIADAAARSAVQFFATTHSWECIQAAHAAFQERGQNELRLHRLEQVDGSLQAVTLDQEQLTAVIEAGWELR
jgi:hypothetical protein